MLTINQFKYTILINTTEKRFNFTDIISYIGEWVPSKNWLNLFAVSVSATVSAVINGNVSGEYICELLVLFHRGENKQAAEEIHWFPSLKLSKHEIV